MQSWEPFGAHRYRIEGDTAFFEVHGPVSIAEMATHLDRLEVLAKEFGWALTIYDSSKGVGVSKEVRRFVAERMRERPFRAAGAVFGASFPVRVMVTLLVSAVSIFTDTGQSVAYCKTEAEALAYCAQLRERFRSEVAAEQARGGDK